jgi:hypothetical protein
MRRLRRSGLGVQRSQGRNNPGIRGIREWLTCQRARGAPHTAERKQALDARSQTLLLRRTHARWRGPTAGAATVITFAVEFLTGVHALQAREGASPARPACAVVRKRSRRQRRECREGGQESSVGTSAAPSAVCHRGDGIIDAALGGANPLRARCFRHFRR